MKIRRVIRFQEDYEKEKQKDLEKPKKDISSNNDISVKVHSQKNSEDYQESQADSSYNTLDELIKCVENVVAGRLSTNMIGVFGMNSDIVVNNLCHSLQNIRDNINFVGGIEYSDSFSDIYNSIAAIFLDYISSNFDRDYGMDYYIREVLLELEKVYDDFQDDYKYESSFQALSKINRRSERSRNMLSAINRIKQIKNTLSYSRNNDPKFLVIIEMESFDYKTLNNLAKLNSSDLIIIVYSMLDFNLARKSLSNSFGENECMYKFFYSGNYVIARSDE